jgi:Xaa-Pro aminopeptidase
MTQQPNEQLIKECTHRRNVLMQLMGSGVAIVPTAPELIRNRDSHYAYRFDSYFYYLTGFKEPESIVVIVAGGTPKTILFCRNKDLEREIWDGFRFGPEAARETFGFDEAYPISELDTVMLTLLANQPTLFYSLGEQADWDARITQWLTTLRNQARSGSGVPNVLQDVRKLLDRMRLIKSPYEQAIMQQSANIAAIAHNRAMQFTKPNMMEYQIEAEFLHTFYANGAQASAYNSIVAGGKNACTLHYNANNAKLNSGDLLLIDAGCELDGYASDITRTFPVNGKFSDTQRDVYELVLSAQIAAIAVANINHHWNAPHEAALKVLAQGFIDFGLCEGSVDSVLETGSYRQFYMHRTGHWLGLDVHDAGEYKTANGEWSQLQTGNVLTVEPGCYIRPADNVPEHFWNIGIRIEDDVLITEQGCDVLSKDAIKTVADIEALMRN